MLNPFDSRASNLAIAIAIVETCLVVALITTLWLPAQEQKRKSTPKNERASGDLPARIASVNQNTADEEQHGPNKEPDPLMDWIATNGPADYALAVIALAAAIAAIMTLRAIQEQVAANVIAANAAKDSADTARDALILLNRPFLEIEHWDVLPSERGPEVVDIDMRIRNGGLTQAKIEQIVVYSGATGTERLHMRITYDTIVNPKRSAPLPRVSGFPGDARSVRIAGRIDYSDTFRKKHWKTFGGQLRPTDSGFVFEPLVQGHGYNLEDGWGFKPPAFLRPGKEDEPETHG